MGEVLFGARDYDRAQEVLTRTVELQPDCARGMRLLANTLEAKGMESEAFEGYQRVFRMEGLEKQKLDAIERAFREQGTKGISSWVLGLLKNESRVGYVPPMHFAHEYANVGDKQKAFEFLGKAFQEHDSDLVFINLYREFDPLRPDPRFGQILRRINYPQ